MFDKLLPGLDEIGQDDGREAEVETTISEEAVHIPISDFDLAPPVSVVCGTTVRQAVNRMVAFGVGSLLVVDDGKLAGIVTERDILMKLKPNENLDDKKIEDIYTPSPKTLSPKSLVIEAMALMDEGGYRRVPVVDDSGIPIGVLSIKRIVDRLVEFFTEEIVNLPPNPVRKMDSREGA